MTENYGSLSRSLARIRNGSLGSTAAHRIIRGSYSIGTSRALARVRTSGLGSTAAERIIRGSYSSGALSRAMETSSTVGGLGALAAAQAARADTMRPLGRLLEELHSKQTEMLGLTQISRIGQGIDASAIGVYAAAPVSDDSEEWHETEGGLWIRDPSQLIAAAITAYVALSIFGLYVREMNRTGTELSDLNRVELLLTIFGWLGLQWTGHRWIVTNLRKLNGAGDSD